MSTGVGTQTGDDRLVAAKRVQRADSPGEPLSPDRLYDVLAHRRRRLALHYLQGVDGRVDLGRLSEQVAAWENDCSLEEVTSVERKRAYTALQQSHLPVMNDAGVVEFDKDRGVIEPTGALEDVDIYVDVVGRNDVPWSEYYLALGLLGCAIVVASWANVPSMTAVPDVGWTAFLAVSLLVSAVGHRYQTLSQKVGTNGPPPEGVK